MCSGFIQRNLQDLKSKNLWKAAVAEILGTAFLVFLGCASCLGATWGHAPSNVQISLTFGLAVAMVANGIGHVSGGHVNPAVSIAMLVTRRITLIRCIVYVISQCLGSVLGATLVKVITPPEHSQTLGLTSVNPVIKAFPQGLAVEAIITFLLVFTVFACCDSNRPQSGHAALTIGLSISLCHFVAVKYTGSSMNPARTFGPALVGRNWPDHWIYWLGPIVGGILAGLLYDFIFAENACPAKVTKFLGSSLYEGEARYDVSEDASGNAKMRNEQKKMIEEL